jgi:phospholipid/cholesterol/gamma-HCH transport system substrate-binding protein
MAETRFTTIAGRGKGTVKGVSPFGVGLIALVVIAMAAYFAYTKNNPFSDPFELEAVFKDANEIKRNAPVRIAGVNVGKVKSVEPVEDGSGYARVKMGIADEGLPIKKDAQLRVRSRLFLEGSYFIDIEPGSPAAPKLSEDDVVPPNQTGSPVQFGEFLTALQSDTREDLRTFLREYSKALEKGGAEGFNKAIKHWEGSYRGTAIVSDATLGTQRHDLSRVLRGQGKAFGALSRDEEALKDLVTNLNTTAAALAREDDALKATIPALRDVLKVGRPALQSLNSGLPHLRAFARDALPAARSSSPTLDAQLPFIKQARRLIARRELGGLVADLRDTVPSLVRLNKSQARSLEQSRALSACQNNTLLPFVKKPIPNPDFPEIDGEPWFEMSPRALVGLSGESRLSDANSPFFRVQGGGGPQTLVSTGDTGEQFFGQTLFPIEGARPARPTRRPVFRPNVPCETQEVPDLNAPLAAGDQAVTASADSTPKNRRREARAKEEFDQLVTHLRRMAKDIPSVDPLLYDERNERIQERKAKKLRKGGRR